MSQCQIISSGITDVGCVRERNEDAFLEMPESGLWCVADGMGGHYSGDLASQRITDILRQLGEQYNGPALVERIPAALRQVNTEMRTQAQAISRDAIIGSTVVVLVLEGETFHCFWTGDSRCYLWRDDQLKQITRDHSVGEDDRYSGNQLTQAIGAFDEFYVDIETGVLYEGDTFLLCTDGLTKVFDDEMLADRLKHPHVTEVNEDFISEALTAGARDNVTSVILSLEYN